MQALVKGREIGWTPFLGSLRSGAHWWGLGVRVGMRLIGTAVGCLLVGRPPWQSLPRFPRCGGKLVTDRQGTATEV